MRLCKTLFSPSLSSLAIWVLLFTLLRILFLFLSPHLLFGDEAQYWWWAQNPAWGYYSKPPMVAWMIALSTNLGHSDAESWVRLMSPIAHGLTALCVYGIGKQAFEIRTGFWAGLVYLTLPAVFFSSAIISTDPFLLLFWAAGLWMLLLAHQKNFLIFWILAGLAFGLGILSKYTMLCWLAGVFFAIPLGFAWHQRGGFYLMLACGLMVLLPNLYWNATHGWVTLQHTGDNANLAAGIQLHPDKMAAFFASQAGVFGIFFIILLWGVVRYRRTLWNHPYARLLLGFTLPLLVVMTLQGLFSRANANWAAPAYIGASVLVVWILQQCMGRSSVLQKSMIAHSVLGVGLMIAVLLPISWPLAIDPFKRLRTYDTLGGETAEILKTLPENAAVLTNHRMLSALLLYYGKPTVQKVLKWNPDGRIDDTFELEGSLKKGEKRTLLLVSRDPIDPITQRFRDVEPLPPLTLSPHPDRSVVWYRAMVRGFKGYSGKKN